MEAVKGFIVDGLKSRVLRLLLAIDQFFNVLLYNGSPDETISSHIYRRKMKGIDTWFDNALCCVLRKLGSKHCLKSLGE